MGKIDIETKSYMTNNERFADVFNYYLYRGKEIIHPEDLREFDVTELFVDYEQDKNNQKENYRDLLKQLVIKYTDRCYYVLLGLENQTKFDYTMPVRNMLTDAMRYRKQIKAISEQHRLEEVAIGKKYKQSAEEFLSHFRKEDKLIPIVTLTLYWGEGPWDAPRSLHEMLDITDEGILEYVADYKLNLVVPYEMNDFQNLNTDLKEVLKVVSVSNNRKAMFDLIEKDDAFKSLNKETAKMIKVCTNLDVEIKEDEEKVNMCTAVREYREEAINIGKEEGQKEATINAILNMLDLGLTKEKILTKYTEEEYEVAMSVRKIEM